MTLLAAIPVNQAPESDFLMDNEGDMGVLFVLHIKPYQAIYGYT